MQKPCVICGKIFEATKCKKFCSPECKHEGVKRQQNELNRRRREAIAAEDEAFAKTVNYKRACHDCGKPTYNYRCLPCRLKWQLRHGVIDKELYKFIKRYIESHRKTGYNDVDLADAVYAYQHRDNRWVMV